jgi:hypothetical protein
MKKNGLDVLEKAPYAPEKAVLFSPLASFTGDGAYGRDDGYREVFRCHPEGAVIVVATFERGAQRHGRDRAEEARRHLQLIAERGRMLAAGIWFTIGVPWWRPISAATSE